ncbi:MAG: phosphoenolpyruvate--protein phosphotransferase [Phycisphaeraceae bacterium]|nr:phosphoenolpyruvate--protein phosphotransferase [Phycisphaeraceae bacterium]
MQIKRGIPVSPGVAIHRVVVLDAEDQPIPRRVVPAAMLDHELKRLDDALAESTREIEQMRDQTVASLGKLADIFSAHVAMINDPTVLNQAREMIRNEHVTAEFAIYHTFNRLIGQFRSQSIKSMRDRATDVLDLQRRILGHLIGQARADLSHLTQPSVIVAHDLTPSQTASLDKSKIKAIATDAGGSTSHTAILAHALGIPAVVGLEDVTDQLNSGVTVIVDGNRGLLVIDPDAEMLMEYRAEERRMAAFEDTLIELKQLPARTRDGQNIELLANIEFPDEIADALGKGAVGIGLYRTEFLYLAAETEPTEQQQYEAYCQAITSLKGRPLTIRTLDLGADKLAPVSPALIYSASERNPFLGCRSIRLCLQNLPLFKTQLRAILRASTEGPVKIMFPLISNIMELRQAKMILSDVMEDLDEQEIKFDRDIPVGIMIEVPSVALQAKVFVSEAAFFSIGTNDLIQYTVAVDRGNERIASLYSGAHPAVIQLIKEVVRAANKAHLPVSLCGEMAGSPEFTMLLLGLGLRSLSITPPAIPEVKKIIRSVSIEQCQRLARKVAGFDSDREVLSYLRGEVRKVIPEAFDGRSLEL